TPAAAPTRPPRNGHRSSPPLPTPCLGTVVPAGDGRGAGESLGSCELESSRLLLWPRPPSARRPPSCRPGPPLLRPTAPPAPPSPRSTAPRSSTTCSSPTTPAG